MYFSFTENMYGKYTLLGNEQKQGRFDFHVSFGSDSIKELKDKVTRIKGTVDMEDFATNQPLEGTLVIDLFDKKELIYDFTFHDDKGNLMHFYGKKNLRYLKFIYTITHLHGMIERENIPIAKVDSVFRLRELLKFLCSFRVGIGGFI